MKPPMHAERRLALLALLACAAVVAAPLAGSPLLYWMFSFVCHQRPERSLWLAGLPLAGFLLTSLNGADLLALDALSYFVLAASLAAVGSVGGGLFVPAHSVVSLGSAVRCVVTAQGGTLCPGAGARERVSAIAGPGQDTGRRLKNASA